MQGSEQLRGCGITYGGLGCSSGKCETDASRNPDTWSALAGNFFATYCNQCHTYMTVASVQAAQSMIKAAITDGSMPQGATLTAATKTCILNWLSAGDPQ